MMVKTHTITVITTILALQYLVKQTLNKFE